MYWLTACSEEPTPWSADKPSNMNWTIILILNVFALYFLQGLLCIVTTLMFFLSLEILPAPYQAWRHFFFIVWLIEDEIKMSSIENPHKINAKIRQKILQILILWTLVGYHIAKDMYLMSSPFNPNLPQKMKWKEEKKFHADFPIDFSGLWRMWFVISLIILFY